MGGQGLNEDGAIGVVVAAITGTVIETSGSTHLTQSGTHYYLLDSTNQGPTLKYQNADVYAGEFGAWTPIGAEQTASGYDIAFKVAGSDQYTVWSTDANGNYLTNIIGVVPGSNQALETIETTFHQDLNGDGTIGVVGAAITGTVIELSGSLPLTQSGTHYYLLDSTNQGPTLKYQN